MKTQPVPPITSKLLPPGASPRYLRALRQKKAGRSMFAWHVLTVVLSVHFRYAVQALNRWATAGTILLVIFCFASSAMPWGHASLMAAALIAVVLRGARMHKTKPPEGVRPILHYALVSGKDSATAALLGLASSAMLVEISPSNALPSADLWRGAVICLPLFFILRLYLNMEPDFNMPPGSGSEVDPEKIYREVWGLGILWMVSFMGVVACNVTDIPYYVGDFVRAMSVVMFGIWWLLQKDCLGRFDKIRTLFTDVRKVELRRKCATLAKGLRRGEAFYPGYVALEIVIHGVIGLSLVDAVLPWLTGHSPAPSFIQAMGAIVSAGTSILTWRFVKESNRVAAGAIQEAMARTR